MAKNATIFGNSNMSLITIWHPTLKQRTETDKRVRRMQQGKQKIMTGKGSPFPGNPVDAAA
jgi:hypothetical protein